MRGMLKLFLMIASLGLFIIPLQSCRSTSSGNVSSALLNNLPKRADARSPAGQAALVKYAQAVQLMRADGSWQTFVDYHRLHCPHRNWYFLPWHRAYMSAFENQVRQVLNDPDYALPYWNWTANSTLPPEFLNPNSPLYNPTRSSNSVNPNAVSQNIISQVMAYRDFNAFASGPAQDPNSQRDWGNEGLLEGTPHNSVHGGLGGDMGDANTSPNDPIFWLHHNNIDRIWAHWTSQQLGRSGVGSDRPGNNSMRQIWEGKILTPFNVSVASTLDVDNLTYWYDDLPIPDIEDPDDNDNSPITSGNFRDSVTGSTWILTSTSSGNLLQSINLRNQNENINLQHNCTSNRRCTNTDQRVVSINSEDEVTYLFNGFVRTLTRIADTPQVDILNAGTYRNSDDRTWNVTPQASNGNLSSLTVVTDGNTYNFNCTSNTVCNLAQSRIVIVSPDSFRYASDSNNQPTTYQRVVQPDSSFTAGSFVNSVTGTIWEVNPLIAQNNITSVQIRVIRQGNPPASFSAQCDNNICRDLSNGQSTFTIQIIGSNMLRYSGNDGNAEFSRIANTLPVPIPVPMPMVMMSAVSSQQIAHKTDSNSFEIPESIMQATNSVQTMTSSVNTGGNPNGTTQQFQTIITTTGPSPIIRLNIYGISDKRKSYHVFLANDSDNDFQGDLTKKPGYLSEVFFFGHADHSAHAGHSMSSNSGTPTEALSDTVDIVLDVSAKLAQLKQLAPGKIKLHVVPTDGPIADGEVLMQSASFEVIQNN